MNNCRTIRPLLYLYRDGELTNEEQLLLNQHLESCTVCSAIRQQLLEMDSVFTPHRAGTPGLSEDRDLIESLMQRIDGERKQRPSVGGFDILIGWTRPAFATLVLTALVLTAAVTLVFQQSRDALRVSELEQRLAKRGVVSTPSIMEPYNLRLLDDKTVRHEMHSFLGEPPQNAAMAESQFEMFRSFLPRILGNDDRMFTQLARRYPKLARVNLDDGLDASERKILSTEGKTLLKEFERLLKEGEE